MPLFQTREGGRFTFSGIRSLLLRLGNRPGGLRYLSRRGSLPVLYGLWADSPVHPTLLLVEGEFNALSIWQCLPEGVTCLSFGSEGGAGAHWLEAATRSRERLILWADDPQRALALRATIGRPVLLVHSPRAAGLKLDANALLQHGLLMDFLSGLLGVRCLGRSAPEALEQSRARRQVALQVAEGS